MEVVLVESLVEEVEGEGEDEGSERMLLLSPPLPLTIDCVSFPFWEEDSGMEAKVLEGRIDLYNGITVSPQSLPNTEEEFQEILQGIFILREGLNYNYDFEYII